MSSTSALYIEDVCHKEIFIVKVYKYVLSNLSDMHIKIYMCIITQQFQSFVIILSVTFPERIRVIYLMISITCIYHKKKTPPKYFIP